MDDAVLFDLLALYKTNDDKVERVILDLQSILGEEVVVISGRKRKLESQDYLELYEDPIKHFKDDQRNTAKKYDKVSTFVLIKKLDVFDCFVLKL